MADENLQAIDDESKAMLEDHVKKGKARKFILITKGSAIKTLIVFKKGPFAPKIAKAKKDGFKGEATCGVIIGKGVNITFQLPGNNEVSGAMKAEGNVYDGEPCKIAKLRTFFKDQADLKFKPEFDIVTSLDKVVTVSELGDETEENVAEVAIGDVELEEQKQKLIAALQKMTPVIQQAVAADPQRKNEILAPAAEIRDHVQAGQLEEAKQGLLAYNEFLKETLGKSSPPTGTAPPPPPPPPGPQSPQSARESEWNWRLKELTPQLKEVLDKRLGDFAQAGALFKQAQAAKSGDTGQAVELLKQCAAVVKLALSSAEDESTDPTTTDYELSWQSAAAEFDRQRDRVADMLTPEQLTKFDKLVERAKSLAGQRDFQSALQTAMQIAGIAELAAKKKQQSEVTSTIAEKIVEKRRFLVERWREIPPQMSVEVNKLKSAIATDVPDEDSDELAQAIEASLQQFYDNMKEAIDLAIQSGDGEYARAIDEITRYRQEIASDDLIRHLEENPLDGSVRFDDVLLDALDEIEAQLAG